jgi:hypothetical protein
MHANYWLEDKRPFGKTRFRLEDNIKMDLNKIGWVWNGLIWLKTGPMEGSCEHDNVLPRSIIGWEFVHLSEKKRAHIGILKLY